MSSSVVARALEATLDELLPGDDEHIEMGAGAVITPRGLRELLRGGFARLDNMPAELAPYESFPASEVREKVYRRSEAERARPEPLLDPIRQWARQHGARLIRGDLVDAFRLPADAERHAARRLSIEPAQVKLASRVLWDHRDFSEERDSRIGDEGTRGALDPRALQARRGLAARDMLTGLREFLDEVYPSPATAGARQPIVAAVVTSRR